MSCIKGNKPLHRYVVFDADPLRYWATPSSLDYEIWPLINHNVAGSAKSSPRDFFCSFLRNRLEFQSKVLPTSNAQYKSYRHTGWPKKLAHCFVRLNFIKYWPNFKLISLSVATVWETRIEYHARKQTSFYRIQNHLTKLWCIHYLLSVQCHWISASDFYLLAFIVW